MIYIVTGFMRTGTSMMMRALEAAGLEAVYRKERDSLVSKHSDEHFSPNIGGLYELERKDYMQEGFPGIEYEGKLIKILGGGVRRLRKLETPGYRIISMLRDPEEIRQSYEAFFGAGPNKQNFVRMHISQPTKVLAMVAKTIRHREDIVSYIEVPYRGVIKNPRHHFELIRDSLEIDLDIDAAVAIVDPKQCHFLVEKLIPGI